MDMKGRGDSQGCLCAFLLGCWSTTNTLECHWLAAQVRQNTVQDRVSACVSWIRNREVWDRCCGSQSSRYPDAAGDHGELRTVVHKSVLPYMRTGRAWLSLGQARIQSGFK